MVGLTGAGWYEGLVVNGWRVTSDAMLISISDSVPFEMFGIEAVAMAPDGLSGDLNAEDLDSPFL